MPGPGPRPAMHMHAALLYLWSGEAVQSRLHPPTPHRGGLHALRAAAAASSLSCCIRSLLRAVSAARAHSPPRHLSNRAVRRPLVHNNGNNPKTNEEQLTTLATPAMSTCNNINNTKNCRHCRRKHSNCRQEQLQPQTQQLTRYEQQRPHKLEQLQRKQWPAPYQLSIGNRSVSSPNRTLKLTEL